MDRLLDQLLYSSEDHDERQFVDNLKNSPNSDHYHHENIDTGCLRAFGDHTRMCVNETKSSDNYFKISDDQLKSSNDHTIPSDDKIKASETKMFCNNNKASVNNNNCLKILGDQIKTNQPNAATNDNVSMKREQYDLKTLFWNVLNEKDTG